MHSHHHNLHIGVPVSSEHKSALEARDLFPKPFTISDVLHIDSLKVEQPALVPRQETTSTSSSSTSTFSCGPKDTTGPCERSVSASRNTTLPIVLGIAIPLGLAFVVFMVLQRRHVRKLRQEDAEDKYKSMDFGVDGSGLMGKKKAKGENKLPNGLQMEEQRGGHHKNRGLSLDMGNANPYILPPELHQSRESLHSLSRSMINGDDKYRATNFIPDDGSIRSPSVARHDRDDMSTFTGSSRPRVDSESNRSILRHAQPNPQSAPYNPRDSYSSMTRGGRPSFDQKPRNPLVPVSSNNSNLLAPKMDDVTRESYMSTASSNGAAAAFRKSNDYLGMYIRGGQNNTETTGQENKKANTTAEETRSSPDSELQSPPPVLLKNGVSKRSSFHEQPAEHPTIQVTPHSATVEKHASQLSDFDFGLGSRDRDTHVGQTADRKELPAINEKLDAQPAHESIYGKVTQVPMNQPGHNHTGETYDYYEEDDIYSMDGFRDSLGYDPDRLSMGVRPLPPDDPSENPEQRANRIRSFYKEYFEDSKSPEPGNAISYYDGSEQYQNPTQQEYVDDYYGNPHYHHAYRPSFGGQSISGQSDRQRATTISHGSYIPGPRAFSSASGRFGPPPRVMPKKKLPPPKPLQALPTPHLLKDDDFMGSIDYAPPSLAKLQRSGTPDSLRGGVRPYSQSVRAHVPLASSFDDLAVMPSPYALRKSGTFTGLDFAPPPKFRKEGDTQSDSGSIRSNRSNVSAMQLQNIRSGAYRLSRIPKEVAGSKDELSQALRPTWNMNR